MDGNRIAKANTTRKDPEWEAGKKKRGQSKEMKSGWGCGGEALECLDDRNGRCSS